MAFASYRTVFKGDLAGIKVEQLKELDYKKSSLEERKEYINNKYKEVKDFYEAYIFCKEKENRTGNESQEEIQEFYKVNLNTGDELSSNINIFKYCERDASYLLNSSDLPRDKRTQYKFLTEEEFTYLIIKENMKDITDAECIHMQEIKPSAVYINMDTKIGPKDFLDEELMDILIAYENARIHLKNEMKKIKNGQESYLNIYQIKNLLAAINVDMIDVKKVIKSVTRPSTKKGDESGDFNIDDIDYTNPKHIKAILTTISKRGISPSSDLSHLRFDMDYAIEVLHKENKLDKKDIQIIEGISYKIPMSVLGEELGISKQAVAKRISKITKKIAEFYRKK